jgi:ADP-heptose:LPS heptosyltransferase
MPAPKMLEFGFSSLDSRSTVPSIVSEINNPIIAVVMGSSWESKDWFFEGYYDLVNYMLSSGKMYVVLLGDPSKRASAYKLAEMISSPRLIDLVGKTSLLELTAVLKKATVAVGPDSGPSHVATAVGTPYVALFGPTSPERVAPHGSEHLVVKSGVDCAPCYKKRCPGLNRICMRTISVEQVKEKILVALAMNGKNELCFAI